MPTVLVTGATDGIGRETAKELVRRGARVIVHGRSAAKVASVLEELGADQPEPVVADLASLADVRRMGEALAARPEPVDVLLANAGVYMNEARTSADGFEMTFAVNHLAPFLLTHLLLPRLRATPGSRVVNVSSVAHNRGRIDLATLGSIEGFEPYRAYAASKLANVLFTTELARRLGGGPPTVNALHPGVVSTKLLTEGFKMRGQDSLADGAATSVELALSPSVASTTGRYFSARREAPTSQTARDAELARAFYEASCALVGVAPLTS